MERLIIVVRADLDPGLITAQVGHAVAAFAVAFPGVLRSWHLNDRNIVVLASRDELHLRELYQKLAPDTLSACFSEPDLNDELTAFACSQAPKQFSSLPKALKRCLRAA
jgi:hypothetical protein